MYWFVLTTLVVPILGTRTRMYWFVLTTLVVPILGARRIVDLTHTFDENAPKLPLNGFGIPDIVYFKNQELLAKYFPERELWLELRRLEFYEHQGTHMDAPSHFGKGRQAMHEIPPERLMGPGVVIDVKAKAKLNRDYAITVDDIKEYEAEFGRIPEGAIVMMNSGWAAKYPNAEMMFGSSDIRNFSSFHYPGWSIEACRMLNQERRISVLGSDTTSIDPNQLGDLDCHRYLQPLNVPLLEYVANLDNIPQNGTTIFLGNIKVRGGTGGPTRIFAVIDEKPVCDASSSISIWSPWQQLFIVCFVFLFTLY